MHTLIGLALMVSLAVPALGQNTRKPANETAAQFYLRYRAIIASATSLQPIVDHWSVDQREDFKAAPDSQRPSLDLVKSVYAATTEVKVVKESSTPNFATLDIQGMKDGKPVTTTIDLVREKGAWKVASGPERWE